MKSSLLMHSFLASALALTPLVSEAKVTRTKAPTAEAFLCESSSDGSRVEFVNRAKKAMLYIDLVNTSDYGGAIFSGITASDAASTVFTLDAIPTNNTSNVNLRLAVKATASGKSSVFTVSPTSANEGNGFWTFTFDFSKYSLAAGTEIEDLAAVVENTSGSSGAVYIYGYTLNETAITKRAASTAGCPSF